MPLCDLATEPAYLSDDSALFLAQVDSCDLRRRGAKQVHPQQQFFAHVPLDLRRKQIRLLSIEYAAASQLIRCSVEAFEQDSCPAYDALSYVWGQDAPSYVIRVNGSIFHVRQNLWNALRMIKNGDILIRGNTPYQPSYLWIDQLCIDQKSTHEKNHQVQAMSSIFSEAEQVVCWLGAQWSATSPGMALITRFLNQSGEKAPTMDAPNRDEIHDLEEIFKCQYWSRLWIAQEFILGRKLLIATGSYALPWEDLRQFEDCGKSLLPWIQLVVPGAAANHFHFRRQREDHMRLSSMSLESVLSSLSHLSCVDVRDKICGLVGLTYATLAVDYHKSSEEVFWDTWMAFDLRPGTGETHTFFELGIIMGVDPTNFRRKGFWHETGLCWQCSTTSNRVIHDAWAGSCLNPRWDFFLQQRVCDNHTNQSCSRCSELSVWS